MRDQPTILHVDIDAFFASVEQRDKPSLRGKPVVVGGVGGRGVVATASYEARAFGVHSAMPTAEARRRCPHAAFLTGRFHAYQEASGAVMTLLREFSPLVEPLSMDEAFVDLAAGGVTDLSVTGVGDVARDLKARLTEVTGGLTGSVGIASSKLVAKIASDLDKPDGLVVIAAGNEADLLRPMQVTVIPGVGPATAERLRRIGVSTVEDLLAISEDELVRVVGQAHGRGLFQLARAEDDRPVLADREAKSVSVEDTYETDHVDPRLLRDLVERHATKVVERLRESKLSGRTVTVKIRLHDFSTHTRSSTLPAPTDDVRVVARLARSLLTEVDTSGGVRLLGVGVSGLADWIQEDLFADQGLDPVAPEPAPVTVHEADGPPDDPTEDPTEDPTADPTADGDRPAQPAAEPSAPVAAGEPALPAPLPVVTAVYAPGVDVEHDAHGRGWVWGSGKGVVTVRFETALTGPGRVLSFSVDDPALHSLHRPRR